MPAPPQPAPPRRQLRVRRRCQLWGQGLRPLRDRLCLLPQHYRGRRRSRRRSSSRRRSRRRRRRRQLWGHGLRDRRCPLPRHYCCRRRNRSRCLQPCHHCGRRRSHRPRSRRRRRRRRQQRCRRHSLQIKREIASSFTSFVLICRR